MEEANDAYFCYAVLFLAVSQAVGQAKQAKGAFLGGNLVFVSGIFSD